MDENKELDIMLKKARELIDEKEKTVRGVPAELENLKKGKKVVIAFRKLLKAGKLRISGNLKGEVLLRCPRDYQVDMRCHEGFLTEKVDKVEVRRPNPLKRIVCRA